MIETGGGDGLGRTLWGAVKGPFDGFVGSLKDFKNETSFANGVHIGVHLVDTAIQLPSYLLILPKIAIGVGKSLGTEARWHEAMRDQYQVLTNDNVRRDLGIMFWGFVTGAIYNIAGCAAKTVGA